MVTQVLICSEGFLGTGGPSGSAGIRCDQCDIVVVDCGNLSLETLVMEFGR